MLKGARYLDRLLVDDMDEVKIEEENVPSASQDGAPGTRDRPPSSRPRTGFHSLDPNANASTRAAILFAVANKFYLLSAVSALFK